MRRQLPLLLAVCAACHTDRITTQDPVVSFDAHVWAGGALHLTSAAFNSPSLPLVMLGNDTLTVQRLDSMTVEARVPDTPGTLALVVETPTSRGTVGVVVVHGLASAHALDLPVNSFIVPLAWPTSSTTFIVGAAGAYQLVGSRTGSLKPFFPSTPYTPDCFVSPSSAGGNWLLLTTGSSGGPGCRSFVVAPTPGTLVPMDSLAGPAKGHFVDGTWILISQWQISTFSPTGASATPYFGEASAIAVSPGGDRGVPLGGRMRGGPFPLFRTGAGVDSIAVPPSWGAIAAAYDPSGDTLFMLGAPWVSGGPELRIVDAVGDSTLRTVTDSLPSTYHSFATMDVAVDPLRPWIYVASVDSARVTVVVFDRASAQVAAVLHGPYGAAVRYPIVRLALDAQGRTLGVLVVPQESFTLSEVGTRLFSFDLMP